MCEGEAGDGVDQVIKEGINGGRDLSGLEGGEGVSQADIWRNGQCKGPKRREACEHKKLQSWHSESKEGQGSRRCG